jgi:diguanylate cyclase (GGDEF)-like protein
VDTTRVSFSVLLLGCELKETEMYSELIREVADCKIDVLSQISPSLDSLVRSRYQLVLADLSGLGSEGLTLLERIKRVSSETSVVLLSSQSSVPEAVDAIRMGAEDYLPKPFNPEMFKLAIKRGLDKSFVFSDNNGVSGYLHLLNSCQMISSALEKSKIFETLKSYLSQELLANHCGIYGADGVRVGEASHDRAMDEILEIAVSATQPFTGMVEAGQMYRFVERGPMTPALFVFRFRCVDASDLFCVCLSPTPPAVMEVFENRLRLLLRQVEVTGNNIKQYIGVRNLAFLDDATGLYNTRYMSMILDREIARSKESQRSFAVLFIDADKFKSINDQHGHLVGTRLLNELGKHLKRMVRGKDTVFRYGGDEFVAILSQSDLATAQMVAERIRHSVEEKQFEVREDLRIQFTVSIGVALYPDHAQTKKEVIEMADHAMFTAKRASRNQVFVISPSEMHAARPQPTR